MSQTPKSSASGSDAGAPTDAASLLAQGLTTGAWPERPADRRSLATIGMPAAAAGFARAYPVSGGPIRPLLDLARCPWPDLRGALLPAACWWLIAAERIADLAEADRRLMLIEAVGLFGPVPANSELAVALRRVLKVLEGPQAGGHRTLFRQGIWSLCRRSGEYRALFVGLLMQDMREPSEARHLLLSGGVRHLRVDRASDVGDMLRLIARRSLSWNALFQFAENLMRRIAERWIDQARAGGTDPGRAIAQAVNAVDLTTMAEALRAGANAETGRALLLAATHFPSTTTVGAVDFVRFAIAHLSGFEGEIRTATGDRILRLDMAQPTAEEIRTLAPRDPYTPVAPHRTYGTIEATAWTTLPNSYDPAGGAPPGVTAIHAAELRDVTINRDGGQIDLAGRRYFTGFQHWGPYDDVLLFDPRYLSWHPDYRGSLNGKVLVATPPGDPVREVEHGLLASGIRFHHNFGHFVYQTVPNILAFRHFNPRLKPRLIMLGREYGFHRPYFDLLGVDYDVLYTGEEVVQVRRLHVLEEPERHSFNLAKWRLVRDLAPPPRPELSPFGERIYLSRDGMDSRRVSNEDELMAYLAPLGFEKVVIQNYPAEVQIGILEKAKAIVGPHGSAFANLIFCRTPKILVEGHAHTYPELTTFHHWLGFDPYHLRMATSYDPVRRQSIDRFPVDQLRTILSAVL